MQTHCCGDDAVCKAHFSKVKLVFLSGLPKDSIKAYYRSSANAVRISHSYLFNSYHEASIEQALLHELGHACQYALAKSENRFDSLKTKCSSSRDVGNAGFNRLPAQGGACLNKALEYAVSEGKGITKDYCFNRMQKEGFANMIFAHKSSSTFHWAHICSGKVSKRHSHFYAYSHCILENPAFQRNFCR